MVPSDTRSSGPPAGSAKAALLPGALTEAGRTAEFHAAMRRDLEADTLAAAAAGDPIEAEIDLAFASAARGDHRTAEATLRATIRATPDSGFAFRARGAEPRAFRWRKP